VGAVKHIALVRFKAGTSAQVITECFTKLRGLRAVIDGIIDYSWGANTSPEDLSQGFTHALIMTFKDAMARDAYLAHPAHEKAKASILPQVESVVIFDYEA
jgi:hypothetical protein